MTVRVTRCQPRTDTSMEYLEKKAPDIPAPRPHGLIAFGYFRVIFMSYIPDMTLTQAWPSLSQKGKLSIQRQLDDIFCRLRAIRQDGSYVVLGDVCGEGVERTSGQRMCPVPRHLPQSHSSTNYNFPQSTMAAPPTWSFCDSFWNMTFIPPLWRKDGQYHGEDGSWYRWLSCYGTYWLGR